MYQFCKELNIFSFRYLDNQCSRFINKSIVDGRNFELTDSLQKYTAEEKVFLLYFN